MHRYSATPEPQCKKGCKQLEPPIIVLTGDLPQLRLAMDGVPLQHPEIHGFGAASDPERLRVGIGPSDAPSNASNLHIALDG